MESIDNIWKANSLIVPKLPHAEIQCYAYPSEVGKTNLERSCWKLPLGENSYEGNYFHDCEHGNGLYKWINLKDEETSYEGQLYANDRDGYGTLSYSSGELFEGLFKNNKRFGPGIFTYNNGLQDVGFWDNLQLRRLCGKLKDDKIPKIATTHAGKAKLLRYKHLVPISKEDDLAMQILKELSKNTTLDEDILAQSHLLYSDTCRDPKSLFFDKDLFDGNIYRDNDSINVVVWPEVREKKSLEFGSHEKEGVLSKKSDCNLGVRKISIKNLIAWNNGTLPMEILKHTFKNRFSEGYLAGKIDKLLACDRKSFRPPGTHEENSIRFLHNCATGQTNFLRYLLNIGNVHPDVTDAKGNSGLFYAANEDHYSTIKTLAKIGADFNHLNDEGLTPLTMSLLRYLAVQNNVSNWETAFLSSEKSYKNLDQCSTEWSKSQSHDNVFDLKTTHVPSTSSLNIDLSIDSFDCLPSKSNIFTQFLKSDSSLKLSERLNNGDKNDKRSKYIFNTELKDHLKKDKVEKVSPKKKMRGKQVDRANSKINALIAERNELDKIKETIALLLYKGADPNVGDVPFPPIILGTFTKNIEIIEMLLRAGADPNTKTRDDEGGLTPLHVILSMDPSPFLANATELFLKYKANPNLRASPNFWSSLDKTLISESNCLSTTDVLGKTPLHMLCMRPDVEEENGNHLLKLAHILLKNKANPNLLFMGHSPLSIAMVKGYKELVHELLSSERVDPNQELPGDLGVPLTLLLHEDYIDAVPYDLAISLMNLLTEFGANPLIDISENMNAYEFALNRSQKVKQNAIFPTSKKSSDRKKEVSKKRKENKLTSHLRELVKRTLVKQFEGNIVRKIYTEPVPKEVKKLPQHTRNNIHFEKAVHIFRKMGDAHERLQPAKVEKTLEFVIEQEHEDTKSSKMQPMEEEPLEEETRLGKLVGYLCEPSAPKTKSMVKIVPAEVDKEHKRYRACFQCLTTKGYLIRCPMCHLVWFCSGLCNKKNSETSNKHQCPLFYDQEYARLHALSGIKNKRSKSSKSSKFSKRSRPSSKNGSSSSERLSQRKDELTKGNKTYDHINKQITQRYIEFLLQMAGSGHQLDLDCLYFPYCAYFDGNLYYRLFSGTLMCQGNYSII